MNRDFPASTRTPHPEVRRFISLLHDRGAIFEIRVPKYGKYRQTASGYFDNIDDACQALGSWDGVANLYITLNGVSAALLARAANRIAERVDHTTSDADVARRSWLLFDIDPVRPAGISSTGEELGEAIRLADRVASFLLGQGWPEPVVACSGNGAYLLYRVDLPNDTESNQLLHAVLDAMAERFDTAAAKVDRTVSNASRIVGIVGSLKMKGENLPARPHRRSFLARVPAAITPVDRAQLAALVEERPPAAGSKTVMARGGTEALATVLERHGVEFREQAPDANGITWYHVRQCPWHDDGRPFECGVGQKLPDGPYAGKCFHPEGDGQGWQGWKRKLGLTVGRDPSPPAGPRDRPLIPITARHRRDIASDAWAAMLAANDPVRFFSHGDSVAEIRRDQDGAAVIRHLGTAGLSGRMDRIADFVRETSAGLVPARPPKDVIEDMEALENPLPRLRGITSAPVFSAGGELETTAGYQPITDLYYDPEGQRVSRVPEVPDETDLRSARTVLNELLGDFPWADERASRANIIAALVTPLVRELVHGPVPLFALDAPKAGNGKGLLARCVGLALTGREVAVMSETRNDEEFRKRITTKLMEGEQVLLFDNIRRRIDSGAFAALLTAVRWSDRVLGHSRAVTLPIRSLFLVTGNNLQFSDEITRRTVSVRIDAKADRPWEGRTFRHQDLIGWLTHHRHEVIWSCLVFAQNWIARGRPAWGGQPMGSYESWCGVVGGIVEHAGIHGFLDNRAELYRRGDADSEEWRTFTSGWSELYGTAPVKAADLLGLAEEAIPSLFEEMKDRTEKGMRQRLGKALGQRQDTRFADLFIRRAGVEGHTKTATWSVEHAGDGPNGSPTPAQHPQENDRLTDSIAGDAGDAGNDCNVERVRTSLEDEAHALEEICNPHPQYPHHPQADSNEARNGAGDVRVFEPDGAQHPQCRRCGGDVDLPSANLCAACRRAALSDLMRGQQYT